MALPAGVLHGTLASPTDEDWYRLPLAAGRGAILRIDWVDPCMEGSLELWNASGSLRQARDARRSAGLVVATPSADAARNVYVRVYSPGEMRGSYSLAWWSPDKLYCPADARDRTDAGDDGPSTAPPPRWESSGISYATSCGADEDWTHLALDRTATIQALLEYNGANPPRLTVLDDALGEVGERQSGESFIAVRTQALAAGSYWIRVAPPADYTWLSYSLRLGLLPPPAECVPDGKEVDDSPSAATLLVADGPAVQRSVCRGDEDWVEVRLPADLSSARVDASLVLAEGEVMIDAFGAPGGRRPLGGFALSPSTPASSLSLGSSIGGDPIWLRLRPPPPGAAAAAAMAVVELSAATLPPACEDDGFEPNDEWSEATPLLAAPGVTTEATLCPDDPDWYGSTLAPFVRFSADVWPDGPAEVSARLWSNAGNHLLEVGNPRESGVHVYYEHEGNSSLSIALEAVSSNASGYRLEAVLAPAVSCQDDPLEPNDTPLAGASWSGQHRNAILCAQNPDCHRLEDLAPSASLVSLETATASLVTWRLVGPGGWTIAEGAAIGSITLPTSVDGIVAKWLCLSSITDIKYSIQAMPPP